MKKSLSFLLFFLLLVFFASNTDLAQSVMIGPRVTGNFNIFNEAQLTGTWNGLGLGIGPTVDISFSRHIGMMINLTIFDMRNFSNSQAAGIPVAQQQNGAVVVDLNGQQTENGTVDQSLTLSYIDISPMFKAEFSGFYMVGGPSIGMKLASSGQKTYSVPNATPLIQTLDINTETIRFDIAVGTGYNFVLSPGLDLGTDFMAYIPITDTYNTPGTSNSVFTLKLGAALKFGI